MWGKDKLGLWDYYNIYTLLYISRQQRATVEYRETIQYSVVTYMGKESEKNGSVQFSHSVVSDSLQPHELQHARPPCPSPKPGVHTNSCPSSR